MNMFQRRSEQVRVFNNLHPLVGPFFWIVSVQYFIIQALVGWNWSVHYSLLYNTISDLGNTVCGMYGDRYVCSPGFTWMNASFIVLGLTMMAGSSLIYQGFRQTLGSAVGFTFMALAGFGTVLVGLFPENVPGDLHTVGAALPFVLGNLALIIFAFALDIPRHFKIYTFASGAVALVALVLFLTKNYLGIGIGGMERIVAHPQTIWLIAFGLYISSHRFRDTHAYPQSSRRH